MNCPFCGQPLVDETVKVCPVCGADLYTPEGKSHLRLTLTIPKEELPGVDKAKRKARRWALAFYVLTITGAVFAILSLILGFVGYFDIFLVSLLKVGFACAIASILFALYFVFKGAASLPGGRLAKTYWPGRIYFLCSGLLNAGLVLAIALSDRLSYSAFYQRHDQAIYGYKDGQYELFSLKLSTDSVEVPSSIEGIPVKSIASHLSGTAGQVVSLAFSGFSSLLIGEGTFSSAKELSSLYFQAGSYELGRNCFEDCLGFRQLSLSGASLSYDSDYSAFAGFAIPVNLTESSALLDFHDHISTLSIDQGCSAALSNGYLRDGVELMPEVEKAVFSPGFDFTEGEWTRRKVDLEGNVVYYPFATDIYLPSSVTNIPANFFGTVGECQIHYGGSPSSFKKIEIEESGNDNFFEGKAEILYYSGYREK